MKEGDQWKIMLGRRVELEVIDEDGSLFIDELVENAIGGHMDPHSGWETVPYVVPNIWITRPKGPRPSDDTNEEMGTSSDGTEMSAPSDHGEKCDAKDGPITYYDEYAPSEISGEGIFDDLGTDDGWGPDDDDDGRAVGREDKSPMGVEVGSDTEDDSSEPGSDWDSSEELSGDEIVLGAWSGASTGGAS